MCDSTRPTGFLKSVDLREDRSHQFSCESSAIGLCPGCFPQTIETDAGNTKPLSIQRPIFDADGELSGVLYRQEDLGLEVLVQIGRLAARPACVVPSARTTSRSRSRASR
jgi:hypothetical protein